MLHDIHEDAGCPILGCSTAECLDWLKWLVLASWNLILPYFYQEFSKLWLYILLLLDCALYVQLAKYKKKLQNTPGVCCFCLMLLTWAICLWNTALQVISIKVNNSLCTMAATYSIIAANACGFAWQWQMFESFSHCHTVTGVDEYILINKYSSC